MALETTTYLLCSEDFKFKLIINNLQNLNCIYSKTMMDNYSDDIGDNFEEEYLDDDYEDNKAPIKNDFWDPPKTTK